MSDEFRLPPPTFEFLVYSLKMQAEMHLGLFGPAEGDEGPSLPAARHTIDMLGMLAEKTRGNLSMDEQRAIENSLTELRFRFVQATREAAAKPPSSEPPPENKADEKGENEPKGESAEA